MHQLMRLISLPRLVRAINVARLELSRVRALLPGLHRIDSSKQASTLPASKRCSLRRGYYVNWRSAEVLIPMPFGTIGLRGRADLLTG
jgi:hypothetical protein